MISLEYAGRIKIIRIDHGKVNALDLELVRALAREFQNPGHERGIVLAGTERVFSAGVDLQRLLASNLEYTKVFLAEFDALVQAIFEHPKPVVAALTGHAIAGGCLLAAACDYRIMGRGPNRRHGITRWPSSASSGPGSSPLQRWQTHPGARLDGKDDGCR